MPTTHLSKLKHFYWQHRRMPSYSELARLLKFKSKNAAQYMVKKWLTAEVVRKDPTTGRLLPGAKLQPLRRLGTIQAGFPSPAEEENTDTISLDDWLIENKEASFMLTVSGDSMIEAGIHPGDMVIVERGRHPKDGDIVIAEIDHEWTMKHFERANGQITLRAANKRYPPITPSEELQIAGVVRAVIRRY